MENRKFLYVGGISLFLRDICVSLFIPLLHHTCIHNSRVCYSKCVEACVSRSAEERSTRARDVSQISLISPFPVSREKDRKKLAVSSQVEKYFKNFFKIITDGACECFRALEGCEAIIDLTHSTRLICDLSPSRHAIFMESDRVLSSLFSIIFRNNKIKTISFLQIYIIKNFAKLYSL